VSEVVRGHARHEQASGKGIVEAVGNRNQTPCIDADLFRIGSLKFRVGQKATRRPTHFSPTSLPTAVTIPHASLPGM
jgi:hypothetical protein